ncbi:hypothetical protein GLOTRDRAFT_68601 [Gloeophyllum trabeum ATCC 11539]|uniref:Zn(2)-C6 fungal-type domain-containing protein n=1 Tax=Gloeophyllum trabeum (strain ATCC 11539 / FP-39264 / Madison 617) TaxID=670483 RepID=S7QMC9_GLOTA|nr:uncharacterized protein GLOTRDRAFT_68601 [Gloeophyllum trabeum ATCC 11539]EPQ60721.1 hypothetical protein GLOTRDRAFT_68601 [Gloeophyllum trabeum ATCC 11539]
MPKAASSSSSRPALRRNQACLSCRKRKLKCDAARPHCGTCVKQWQATISVPPPPGYVHPTEPQCSYDPVEGLPLAPEIDPAERIRQLEEEVVRLKRRLSEGGLRETSNFAASSLSPSHSPRVLHGRPRSSLSRASNGGMTPDMSALAGPSGIALPHASLNMISSIPSGSPDMSIRSDSGSPELRTVRCRGLSSAESLTDLIHAGWNPDLPEPPLLTHYVETFFKCDPCGSRILHRPSFLTSLHLHPRDPGFPHSAILHAICASASRWSPQSLKTMPDGSRRDTFAEYHAGKTRQYIDRTMASGEDIFAVMQACLLLSWYFYQEGRWVEVWIFAGFQTRVAIPLRLNHPGTFTMLGSSSPGAYLAPPKDRRDLESRRRTWWMTILFDRIASVGGWVHAVDERDIGTEFPLRRVDFESDQIEHDNPQDLVTKDVFITHPPEFTDSFLLLLKAVMLFGRVTDYNVRGSLRAASPPSKNQDPFQLDGFEELDRLVCVDFLNHLPPSHRSVFGPAFEETGGSAVDTDLYMVHIIPHAATITLHNPYLDFGKPTWISTLRCVHAAQEIISFYYLISSTPLDMTRLHPFVTICWYLAAVVQVQMCKYYIQMGDTPRETQVWGEINMLRFAMREYGNRSPIGTRQERLLQGLMSEIVRMTSQRQPLELPVPLYPFSHASLFGKDGSNGSTSAASISVTGSDGDDVEYREGTRGAPLPPNGGLSSDSMGRLHDMSMEAGTMGSPSSLNGLLNADSPNSILSGRSHSSMGSGGGVPPSSSDHRASWSNGEEVPRIARNGPFL